jgi:hypothetical protein
MLHFNFFPVALSNYTQLRTGCFSSVGVWRGLSKWLRRHVGTSEKRHFYIPQIQIFRW